MLGLIQKAPLNLAKGRNPQSRTRYAVTNLTAGGSFILMAKGSIWIDLFHGPVRQPPESRAVKLVAVFTEMGR